MERILSRLKQINVKGFTLIEILGVIVIMGLIIIVAIPTMSRMIHNNNNQEYTSYYTMVEEAAHVYAGKLTDELGTSKYSGCTKVKLDDLINNGYVQAFNDKEVTCTTGADDIVIRNEKGSISVKFQLVCTRNGEEEYNTGVDTNDSNVCQPYSMAEEINIKMKLDSDDSLNIVTPSGSKVSYITGTTNKNYIWYSGKMWQIVSYNTSTEIVKAVTVNPITSIYYNSTGNTTFSGSDVETWLNNDFLNSLKDQQNFLTNYNWNATSNSDINTNSSITSSYKKLKVGLITTYEYGHIKGWYGNTPSWVLSEGGNISQNGIVQSVSATNVYSVRPAIVFSSDVLVHSGTGTQNDPYIIDNSTNAEGKTGDLINTRYSGEYVQLNGRKYRIVSVNGSITKIIGTTSLGTKSYDADHYDYADSDLRKNLESSLTTELNYITTGDFCLDTINSGDNLAYRSSKCLTPTRVNSSIKIGLPQFGDLFTTNMTSVTSPYWTLNPNTEVDATGQAYNSTMNVINTNGTVATSTISSSKATVIVLYLDSSVKISSGRGTITSPYILTK